LNLKNSLRKIRYFRHPYLIWRTITGCYEWKFSKRTRVNEYNKHVHPVEDGLRKIFNIDVNIVRDYIVQFNGKIELHRKLNEARKLLAGLDIGMPGDDLALLYVLCRILRPRIVAETSCGNGFSTASIFKP
jgi:hypothetical protein